MKAAYLLLLVSFHCNVCQSASYEDAMRLRRNKLNESVYDKNIRPINSQERKIKVYLSFMLFSIDGVDEVEQSFTCNGALSMFWHDQRVAWDPSEYGNVSMLTTDVNDIWKPQLQLLNTVTVERNPFRKDTSIVRINYGGLVTWIPSALFTVSCHLLLARFPFDEQNCWLHLTSVGHDNSQMELYAPATVRQFVLQYYSESSEWKLVNTSVETDTSDTELDVTVWLKVVIKRRPETFMMCIMLPLLLLSLLDVLLFLIPVESGEKISYGITVLLAQAVFMTILMTMLPASSLDIPRVSIYVFCLLVLAAVNVIISVIVVYLYHKDEDTSNNELPTNDENYNPLYEVTNAAAEKASFDGLEKAILAQFSLEKCPTELGEVTRDKGPPQISKNNSTRGKWKAISRKVNFLSCIVLSVAWIVMSVVFFLTVI